MHERTRWFQLLLGVICMIVISSPQYVWALFTTPLTQSLGVDLAALQVTFSLLIVLQTFLAPCQGYFVDRFGPRVLLSIGAVLTGLSWVLAAHATTITGLYLTYGALGGIGTGIVYVGVVGHMVQWFPDRRGFATGMVAAGYGMGAILTTFPVSEAVAASGYQNALVQFGWTFAVVGVLAALGLRRPPAELAALRTVTTGASQHSGLQVGPAEMLRTPVFWLMFVMMTMMSTSGLMVISQMGAFTADFGLVDAMVFGLPLLPLALSLDRITNGATRPFFGWVSDRFGRENTMTIAFALEGCAMTAWLLMRDHPVIFVLMSGVVFFGWGEIFSLFPSTLTDTFGTKHATTNYGFLYIAQGVGSVLGGPLAAVLHDAAGSWVPVFAVIIVMDFATALLAWVALRPMRRRWIAQAHATRSSMPGSAPMKVVTSTIAVVLLVGLAGNASAQDGPTPTLDEVTLSGDAAKRALTDTEINVETAKKLVDTCLAHAATKGPNGASVVVLSASGYIVYAYRADGQRPNNIDSAREKAKTALYLRQPTRLTFSRWHDPEEQLARRTLDMYIVPGGYPLIVADTLIGSIGVGGASGGDEQCAYEAVRKVMGKQPANWAPPAAP